MKRGIYLFGFFLVAVSVLLQSARLLIFEVSPYVSFDNVWVVLNKLTIPAALFGHPVPPPFSLLIPRFLYLIILGGATFLVLRRMWLFMKNRSLSPPASFTRTPYAIFLISTIVVFLFLLFLVPAIVLYERLRGTANILILPATFLLPVTVCWVELLSFKSGGVRDAQNRIAN